MSFSACCSFSIQPVLGQMQIGTKQAGEYILLKSLKENIFLRDFLQNGYRSEAVNSFETKAVSINSHSV